MSLNEASSDAISSEIFDEKRPITYRVLSRKLSISNDKSRSLLQQYYDKYRQEKASLTPTYILVGQHSHGSDDDDKGDYGEDTGSLLIKLVKADDIEKSKKEFLKIDACYIYSLNMGDLELDNVTASNGNITDELDTAQCATYGVIHTPTAGELSREEKVKIEETARDLKRHRIIGSESKSKQIKVEQPKKKKQRSDPFAIYKSRKGEKRRPFVENVKKVKKARSQSAKEKKQEKELAKMFEDDEDQKMDEDLENGEEIDVEMEDDTPEENNLESKIIGDFLDQGTKNDDEEKDEAVHSVKSYVDKDGYVVTMKDDKKKPKKRQTTRKNGTKSKGFSIDTKKKKKHGPKKQASLMSFFGKKR